MATEMETQINNCYNVNNKFEKIIDKIIDILFCQ